MVRKRRTRQHVIADLAVNHVERQALLAGYTVERPLHDYGYDLFLTTYNRDGEIENGTMPMQVKATDSLPLLADGVTIAFRVRRADLELWLNEAMPCILVIYDAHAERAYWCYVQEHFAGIAGFDLGRMGYRVTIHVPTSQVLDMEAMRTNCTAS